MLHVDKHHFALILLAHLFLWQSVNAHENAQIIDHTVVYMEPGQYCAWPSMVRTNRGDLLVLFTRTEEHVAPVGSIRQVRSVDNGRTWHASAIVRDTVIDDRESGLTALKDGRILGHFWSTQHTADYYRGLFSGPSEPDWARRWIAIVEEAGYVSAGEMAGGWQSISSDNGATWSDWRRGPDSIHGGVQLKDGRILVASYREASGGISVQIADSLNFSWRTVAMLRPPAGEPIKFAEPHVLQLPSGRIIMMIRIDTVPYNDQDKRCVLWATYSDDAGESWVAPYRTGIWGSPPHLLLLEDGRVLCTYGVRRPPYGQRACISDDGVIWDIRNEIVIRDDASSGDLGYPVSIEVEPGVIFSVYYQKNIPGAQDRAKPMLVGTRWRIPRRQVKEAILRDNRLKNLSVRSYVTVDRPLIAGFTIDEVGKRVLVRAAGPTLGNSPFRIANVMPDVAINVFSGNGELVAHAASWDNSVGAVAAQVGAFPFIDGGKDAAVVLSADRSNSAHVFGSSDGVVLAELYEVGNENTSKFTNLSVRAAAGEGDATLIVGFTVDGFQPKSLLIRGIGPALRNPPFNIADAVADPTVSVFDATGNQIARNDDWPGSLEGQFQNVGAFRLPGESKDAAMIIAVNPGAYTAHLTPHDGVTGEALVEIYALPD